MSSKETTLYGIQAGKLIEARKARGYTVAEISKWLGVSRQAVDKYEKGLMRPSVDVLQKYIELLEFPMTYFQSPIPEISLPKTAILHRSLATASAPSRDKVSVRAEWMNRVMFFLSQYCEFPEVTIKLKKGRRIYSTEDIEQIAENLRSKWGLGLGPIDNLTILLQNQGIVVARTAIQVDKSDACSQWVGDQPYVFLTADKEAAVRSRFDLAHELGHILLHYVEDGAVTRELIKELDKEANRFAGAFLLPRQTFAREIISTSLEYFIQLKKRWKVSIAAMIYRCKDLGILSENQTSYLWRQMAAAKMRTKEPLDDTLTIEQPTLFKDAFELLIDNNILTPQEIVEQIQLPVRDLSELCSVPMSVFDVTLKPVRPQLYLVK
ncbi:helix-turn-helix domain-containing protein [Pectinatus frisingensis]|uniref:helix-turn-helix domain-containing protein n=1 Tax=Pectinatus frisingensis TaxID=865 RepID=UPI0018C61AA9|nr:ImmA/IrrE family metallo-endopeptidase [Pectinatus frisingensis]